MADRPRVPRRLRRLAVPLQGTPAATRRTVDTQEAARLLRLLPGPARPRQGRQHQGQERVAPRRSTGTSWSSTSTTSARGATPPRSCSRARTRRSPRRRPSSSTAAGLEDVNEDLGELSENETEFLPITTKAYLYLSGTPFKALATGEFIEEQIFNWTYTDEQRAKEEFAAKQPGQVEPVRRAARRCGCSPTRCPTSCSRSPAQGEFDEFDLNEFFAATGTGATARVQAQERRAEVARHHPRRLRAQRRSTT